MGVCDCSMFCCTLLYVHSSIAIILMGKRELIASWWLGGSSWRCHGVVCSLWLWYFLIILTYYFLMVTMAVQTSSFVTFITYMLLQNVIPFSKELFVAYKMAPDIKKNSLYFRDTDAYIKAISVYWSFSEANCHTRFGKCADIVSYNCKFETNGT